MPADLPPPPGAPVPGELAPLAPPLDPPLMAPPKTAPKPSAKPTPSKPDKLPSVEKVVTNGEPPLAGKQARPTIRIEAISGFVP